MSRADRFRWYWRFTNPLEALQVRWTGASGFALIRRTPVLVIETTGRRSGRRRRTVISYWEHEGRIHIGGGAAGMTRVDWVANLRAHPDAVVYVKRRRMPVLGRELKGQEEELARQQAFTRWPHAAKYERSGRRIPFFRLDPA